MNSHLEDKVCIVTGSSRGIGKGIATAFAREGANIVINYCFHEDAVRETLDELIHKYYVDAEILRGDV